MRLAIFGPRDLFPVIAEIIVQLSTRGKLVVASHSGRMSVLFAARKAPT